MRHSATASVKSPARKGSLGFTLIELLVVMTIIGILVALVIGVAGPVQQQARVSRARAEIAGIETALTRFETDNGFVPLAVTIATNGGMYSGDPDVDTYKQSARALMLAVTGRQWFLSVDAASMGVNYFTSLKEANVKFNPSDTGKSSASNAPSANYASYATAITTGDYLQDPWGNPYGFFYNAASTNNVYSLFNQVTYDLWSTSGEFSYANTNDAKIKRWAANWPNQ